MTAVLTQESGLTPRWEELLRTYVVEGAPPPTSTRLPEEPETYLARLFDADGRPEAALRALEVVLRQYNLTKDAVLGFGPLVRALRLAELLSAPKLAGILTRTFYLWEYSHDEGAPAIVSAALQALRVTHGASRGSQEGSSSKDFWIALGDTPGYEVRAFQGLRYVDLAFAVENLHLLLACKVDRELLALALEGLSDDARQENLDLEEPVSRFVVKQPRLAAEFRGLLSECFTGSLVDRAWNRADQAERERLTLRLLNVIENWQNAGLATIRSLFRESVGWLCEKTGCPSASVWLMDESKRLVAFMAQEGCGQEPPRPEFIRYGTHAAGKAAETGMILSDLESADVLDIDRLRECDLRHVLALRTESGTDSPALHLVINFFHQDGPFLEKSVPLCTRFSSIASQVCAEVIGLYRDRCVAGFLKTLRGCATPRESARKVVESIQAFSPCTGTTLHFFYADFNRLLPGEMWEEDKGLLKRELIPYELGEGLTGYTGLLDRTVRIVDAESQEDLEATRSALENAVQLRLPEIRPEFKLIRERWGSDQQFSFLGRSLRLQAPRGYLGQLVGVLKQFRILDRTRYNAFTPIDEYLFESLARAVSLHLSSVMLADKQGPVIDKGFGQVATSRTSETILRQLATEDDGFKGQVERILAPLLETLPGIRAFVGFRTPEGSCSATWCGKKPPMDAGERALRHRLQNKVLGLGDKLFQENRASVGRVIVGDFLHALDLGPEFEARIQDLGMLILPIRARRRLTGLIGLECPDPADAQRVLAKIDKVPEEIAFVTNTLVQARDQYKAELRMVFAGRLREFALARWNDQARIDDFFDFLMLGRVPHLGHELPTPDLYGRPVDFEDLFDRILENRQESDSCDLGEQAGLVSEFLWNDEGRPEVQPPVKTSHEKARTLIVAATLGGRREDFQFGFPPSDTEGWAAFSIQPTAIPELRTHQGLLLSRAISWYLGWRFAFQEGRLTFSAPLVGSGK